MCNIYMDTSYLLQICELHAEFNAYLVFTNIASGGRGAVRDCNTAIFACWHYTTNEVTLNIAGEWVTLLSHIQEGLG
jgi:hypothetical protein